MYRRAPQRNEEALGAKHEPTFRIMGNLGLLCRDQGNVTEAREKVNLALEGLKHVEGDNEAPISAQTRAI